jgi:hypothetical protein
VVRAMTAMLAPDHDLCDGYAAPQERVASSVVR